MSTCGFFWPQKGEYENVTYFAMDAAACKHLNFSTVRRCIDEIAIFTDVANDYSSLPKPNCLLSILSPSFCALEVGDKGFLR